MISLWYSGYGQAVVFKLGILFARRFLVFFFNDTATTEIYTLSLHDALPICRPSTRTPTSWRAWRRSAWRRPCAWASQDRKSTRLNSSHSQISYAVFCLKKKISYDLPLCHHPTIDPHYLYLAIEPSNTVLVHV